MKLKQTLAATAACALLLGAVTLPASAHGGRHHNASPSYAVCTVEGCAETGRHTHDGVTYCGYDHAGGTCTGASCSGGGHSSGHHGGRHC